MAAKRSATTELNHDNWNEENEPEEAGTFTKAPDDVLEKRVVRAAKRRLPPIDGSTKSAFGTFTGFKTSHFASTPSFSFLANVNTSSSTSTSQSTTTSKPTTSNGASKSNENGADKKEDSAETPATSNTSESKKTVPEQDDEKKPKKSSDYFAKLKGLNESVAKWIKTHVDTNPFCILTPIFKDYEKYLKDIESHHGTEAEKATPPTEQAQTAHSSDNKDTTTTEKKSDSSPLFGNISSNTKSIFGNTKQTVDSTKPVFNNPEQTGETQKSIFDNIEQKAGSKSVFGNTSTEKNPFVSKPPSGTESKPEQEETKSETKTTEAPFASFQSSPPIFSFGQSSTTSNASAGFSFGSAKPFSFSTWAVKPQESDDKGDSDGKDDYEPPKPEIKVTTEEGSIYDQRCKVFVKKDGNFSDRGIGTLFLKPTPNDKMQLIVRAETSLGNLLLNTLLTDKVPTKRMNKNTIMLVCLPKPDSPPPPATVLLRVKSEEDADLLFETLNKHKK